MYIGAAGDFDFCQLWQEPIAFAHMTFMIPKPRLKMAKNAHDCILKSRISIMNVRSIFKISSD